MLIKVKPEHINQGCKRNCFICPIALAISDVLKHCYLKVNITTVVISSKTIGLPKDVSRFIQDFDDGRQVQPFEFELNYED